MPGRSLRRLRHEVRSSPRLHGATARTPLGIVDISRPGVPWPRLPDRRGYAHLDERPSIGRRSDADHPSPIPFKQQCPSVMARRHSSLVERLNTGLPALFSPVTATGDGTMLTMDLFPVHYFSLGHVKLSGVGDAIDISSLSEHEDPYGSLPQPSFAKMAVVPSGSSGAGAASGSVPKPSQVQRPWIQSMSWNVGALTGDASRGAAWAGAVTAAKKARSTRPPARRRTDRDTGWKTMGTPPVEDARAHRHHAERPWPHRSWCPGDP